MSQKKPTKAPPINKGLSGAKPTVKQDNSDSSSEDESNWKEQFQMQQQQLEKWEKLVQQQNSQIAELKKQNDQIEQLKQQLEQKSAEQSSPTSTIPKSIKELLKQEVCSAPFLDHERESLLELDEAVEAFATQPEPAKTGYLAKAKLGTLMQRVLNHYMHETQKDSINVLTFLASHYEAREKKEINEKELMAAVFKTSLLLMDNTKRISRAMKDLFCETQNTKELMSQRDRFPEAINEDLIKNIEKLKRERSRSRTGRPPFSSNFKRGRFQRPFNNNHFHRGGGTFGGARRQGSYFKKGNGYRGAENYQKKEAAPQDA